MRLRFSSRLASALCAVVFLGTLAPAALAGGRPKKVKERDYKQYFDEIRSVDEKAHTVTVATMVSEVPFGKPDASKPPQQEKVTTYKVGATSEIEIGGKKSDLKALYKGMKVTVSKGADDSTLGRLEVKQ